jgi:hypothetical protein
MMTSIPAALGAIAVASSGSPPLNPPTRASIDACVPASVSVTTLACGNPAGWPLASDGPPNAARLAGVSGTSSVNPSTAATRIPR